ncbi:MAG: TlpA family protein disulfide reductase [Bacteroidales bacterium]
MKKLFIIGLLAGLVFSCKSKEISKELSLGEKMPEFSFNEKLNSVQLKGKYTLITFFATWCPPCQKKLPHFEELYKTYKEHPNLNFVFVAREQTPAKVDSVWAELGYTMPVHCDEKKEVFTRFASKGIPRSYLFSPDGTLIHKVVGFNLEEHDAFVVVLKEALKQN